MLAFMPAHVSADLAGAEHQLHAAVRARPRAQQSQAEGRGTLLGPRRHTTFSIEDLNLNPPVSVLLIFASLPDCSQNQTAVSDTLRLLSDF
jgi:hypothetical protein